MAKDFQLKNNHISPLICLIFRKLIQIVRDFKAARMEVKSS